MDEKVSRGSDNLSSPASTADSQDCHSIGHGLLGGTGTNFTHPARRL